MRRIAIAIMSTLSGLVLLFSYHSSTHSELTVADGGLPNTDPQAGDATAADASSSAAPTSRSAASAAHTRASTTRAAAKSASSTAAPSSRRYTGDPVDTRWGTVQVQITVRDGKITKASALQYPHDNQHDLEINSYAVPTLDAEVVQNQSGDIAAVSGATVTSDGYLRSLQSAIDQAHL